MKIFWYYYALILAIIVIVAVFASITSFPLYISASIIAIIAAFFSYIISGRLTKPLKEITTLADEMTKGNFTSRIDIQLEQEFGSLVNSFNKIAKKIETNISDLDYKNIEIESIIDSISSGIIAVDRDHRIILINCAAFDILQIDHSKNLIGNKIFNHIRNNQINKLLSDTIEKNTYIEQEIVYMGDIILSINTSPIKTSNELLENSGGIAFIQDITKLKKLEQIRTEFVSNVTHELKTPLTSIRGFIETLKKGSINDPKRAERFIDIIDIEAERLYLLISDILQLSEIEAKKTDSDISTVDFKELVYEVLEICQNIADEKNILLCNDIDSSLLVNANKNRMKQLLLNLVNNAIKYNVENGSVSVYARIEPGKVIFGVRDTGIGIEKEHMTRIFERFYRVDKGRSRDMGGTGLGLSIVKHIVQLYSGDIKLNSEIGKGSEFIIQLPQ